MGRFLPRQHHSPYQRVVSVLLQYTVPLRVQSHPKCAQPIRWRFARYRETRQKCYRPHRPIDFKCEKMNHYHI